jgi:DNA-binding HxlR family transcriptional regulator
MARTSLADHHCSLARTADIIGDQWMLMILRDAFYGTRTFGGFQSSLGVAKTVLSDRLQRLTDVGIMERVQARDGVERYDYRLTEAGRALFPIVIALVQWGDRWIFGDGSEPMTIIDRATGTPIRPVEVQTTDGTPLGPRDVTFRLADDHAASSEA